jgi:FMN phosphatase YigB (HAD superfamily)
MIKLKRLYEEIKNQQYQWFCDMDGVVADFDKGFKDLTGYLPSDYESKFGKTKFWSVIPTNTSKFWSELPWMPEGKTLWNYIKKQNPSLLTAPSRHNSSRIGKQEWVDKHIPGTPVIFKAAKQKHELATPNSILIDDREDNIERWKNAGGIGILFKNTTQTIDDLKQLGL